MMKNAEKISKPTTSFSLNSKQMQKSRFGPRSFEPTESVHEILTNRGAPCFSYNLLNIPAYPPVQKQAESKTNLTGMPDQLKANIESLSRIDVSDVRVHANSNNPARLNALAYTQGNQIYLGQGQEKQLPHEAWHVVQQAQGRVRPTFQIKGMSANDDLGLEQEADMIGSKMMQEKGIMHNLKSYPAQFGNSNTVQMNCGHCRRPDKENLLKLVLRRQHQRQHQAEREYHAREYPAEDMAGMWEKNYFELIKSDPEAARKALKFWENWEKLAGLDREVEGKR